MSKTEQVEKLTNYMANFVSYIGKVLPDDIIAKLDELAEKEDSPLSLTVDCPLSLPAHLILH